jgi:hypothetical protein
MHKSLMARFIRVAPPLAVLLLFTLASPAHAQTYRCAGANGQAQWSDRPCARQEKLGMIGPLSDPAPRYTARSLGDARTGELPAYYEYLSGECRSLNDAVRTAPVRGVGYETQRDLQKEWQRKCGENASEAMRTYGEAQNAERDRRLAAKEQEHRQTQLARLSQEQCSEMLRILAVKRKRTDLSDGERTDLKRFEDNYRSRCS